MERIRPIEQTYMLDYCYKDRLLQKIWLRQSVQKNPVRFIAFFISVPAVQSHFRYFCSQISEIWRFENTKQEFYSIAHNSVLCSEEKISQTQKNIKKRTNLVRFFAQNPCVSLSAERSYRIMYSYTYKIALACRHCLPWI